MASDTASTDNGSHLLGAVSAEFEPQRFRSAHWEKAPLFSHRAGADFTTKDFENAIETGRVQVEDIAAFSRGVAAPIERFTYRCDGSTRVDVRALADLVAAGHTVVVNRIDQLSVRVAELANTLAESLEVDVGVNAYFTPPGSQGFATHADDHDVFVWQVAGSKEWTVWEPSVNLPTMPVMPTEDPREPPAFRFALREGSLLYLPRGWLHRGRSEAAGSLHLTLGLRAYTWRDELHRLVDYAAETSVLARRRATDDPASLDDLLALLRHAWMPADLRSHRSSLWVGRNQPELSGYLRDRRVAAAAPRVQYRRRLAVRAAMCEVAGQFRLQLAGRYVQIPVHCRATVAWLLHEPGPYTERDVVGGLDLESTRTILTKLVSEGVICIDSGFSG